MAPICPDCGSPLHASALGLACPACLIAQVMTDSGSKPPDDARLFGGYELFEELGRGGMASVYRARDLHLERTVALKMLLAGSFASPEATARFEGEMKAVARLRHPGIVTLYEAGECEGIRFFTMELVEGRTLAGVVATGPLPAQRAARYVRQAAEAVEHAHQHQVLHLDLKPSNILVDGRDQPKVADFGIARIRMGEAASSPPGQVVGSPAYMAPEQMLPGGDHARPATDVYALGAVLYHLLTGRPPPEPVTALRRLNPSISRDLEKICLKALARLPERRYASAADLADDLERFERGEPVTAMPVGPVGRGWRWARRNPALAGALGALVLAVVAGAAVVLRQAVHNRHERERLQVEAYANGMKTASLAAIEGDDSGARAALAALIPPAGQADLRGFEWRRLWAATASQASRTLHPHRSAVTQLAFSPDGRSLATNGLDGTASWLSLAASDGRPPAELAGGGWALAFMPGGAYCFVGGAGTIRLIDLKTHAPVWSLPGWTVSATRDGARIAVALGPPIPWAAPNGGVEIWDTRIRQRVTKLPGDFRTAALSPDGRLLAVAPGDDSVRLCEAVGGRERLRLITAVPQTAIAFSPNGAMVASCGQAEARLWRTSDGRLIARLPHPWLRVWALAFSPSGGQLATTCSDRAVRLWDTANGRCVQTLRGHSDEVWSVAYSPDGSTLATGGKDGSVLLWPLNVPQSQSRDLEHRGWSRPLFSADGKTLICSEAGPPLYARIQRTGEPAQRGPMGWGACALSPDGVRLLLWSGDRDHPLRAWDRQRGLFTASYAGAEGIAGHLLAQAGASPDGSHMYQLCNDGALLLWDPAGGPPLRRRTLGCDPARLRTMALSPHGHWFAWTTTDSTSVWLADLEQGTIRALAGHREEVNSVAFSPAGDELASASSDGTVRLWRCLTGAAIASLPSHLESVADVAFSSDGRTLVSLGTFQSLKFWNLASRREVMTVEMPDAGGFLAFSPDGRRLAVTLGDVRTGTDGGLRVLEAP